MKNKWNLLILLLVICGAAILSYPFISRAVASRNHSKAIEEYRVTAADLGEAAKREEFQKAREYNESLKDIPLIDPFAEVDTGQSEAYLSILNIEGIMGYIEIPAINVSLPIYHTTSEEILKKGVGHMEFSAFPVGGEGNHTVLTAHRGLPSAKLFTDLGLVEEGDLFYIQVLDQKIAYRVDQILTVEPEETEPLLAQAGADYVTLVTCTPYAVNSHRLFVRGVREEIDEIQVEEESGKRLKRKYLLWGLAGTAVVLAYPALKWKKRRRLDRKPKI